MFRSSPTTTLVPYISAAFLLLALMAGCSGGMQTVSPGLPGPIDGLQRPVANPGLASIESLPPGEGGASHNLSGLWTVSIDPASLIAEVVPVREGMFHFNVTKFVDGPPLHLAISINHAESDPLNGLIDCMVTLTHPFNPAATQLCGFDVRGILFTQGGATIGGLTFSDVGETQLLNADGHTRWWNPTEFPGTGLLAFTPGAAAPADYSMLTATLNPYKYFADCLDEDEPVIETLDTGNPDNTKRGIFKSGESNTRRYRIQFPSEGSGPHLIFNYGVDACWAPPTVKPPVILPDDFPISANSPEPFMVEVDRTCNTLWYTDGSNRGGELFLNMRVSDWQGLDGGGVPAEIDQIRVQCPGVFAGTLLADLRWEDKYYSEYVCDVGDYGLPIGAGSFPLLISAVSATGSYDQGFPTAFPSGPVTAYKLIYVDVADTPQEPYELPYADDMGPNTVELWTVENGPGHSPPGGSEWAYHADHWGTANSLSDTFEPSMDTYLVSSELVVPDSGSLTVRYLRAMDADSSFGHAGGQVMYRINGGAWQDVSGFFSSAYAYDGPDVIPTQGQNPSLTGLTPGDTIEIGFHFESDGGVPAGFGYHVYRVVVQEWPALDIQKDEYPQMLSNHGLSYAYMTNITNASPLWTHMVWLGYDYVAEDYFMQEEGSEGLMVTFPSEGKFWVGTNAYLHTPVEWLVSGVGADVDVYSFTPTAGAFFSDEFVNNMNGWDLTIGGDANGDFMQIRSDGSGWLDNRQGESGCYGEPYDGTPTALPEKMAQVSVSIPGAANDGTKTYIRLFHRFLMFPLDSVLVRLSGFQPITADGLHYQSFDPYLGRYAWGWFESIGSPNLEVAESVICIGDAFNGSPVDLQLVSAPKNDFLNCYTENFTFGWQVDYIEMYQTSDPEVYFFEDFNRGFTWTEAYTYPYDLTGGADATGNFWNIVPDQEGGYLTNVQLGTGCWNGTVPAEVNIKSARLFAFIPHTLGSSTIVVRHRFDVEGEGEGMAMLVNGVNVPPDGGFIYNGLGSYWTGSSGGWVESSFTVPPHPVPGDVEEIRFISQAADEIDNCESSGYSGWQIDWIQISG